MDSDLQHQQHQFHQQQKTQSINSGLTRYRSAPSSYFSDLMSTGAIFGDEDTDPFFKSRLPNAQTDQVLSRFTSSAAGGGGGGESTAQQIMNKIGAFEKQFMDCIKQEPVMYQNQFQSQTDRNISISISNSSSNQSVSTTSTSAIVDSLTTPSNLLRQSSSPAGFLSHLDIDNGYPLMRSMDFRAGGGNHPNSLPTQTKRPKNETGFSSGSHLSSSLLPRIPENEAKVMETKGAFNDGGFGSNSWDDADIMSDSFLKDFGEIDQNKQSSLTSSDNQNNDLGRIRASSTLIHHMSLPASSAELNKLMQFQDTVPLRSRAKRGCATHPRSIAERVNVTGGPGRPAKEKWVRRTRISERMRKLQELVPNMDKQTNTADMLDLAVDYIKELQKEAEALSDHHAKCTCPHKQKL